MPATPESAHFINRKTLAHMKPTAFLINTSRGATVNEADLFEALKSKRLAGAGVDVAGLERSRCGWGESSTSDRRRLIRRLNAIP